MGLGYEEGVRHADISVRWSEELGRAREGGRQEHHDRVRKHE